MQTIKQTIPKKTNLNSRLRAPYIITKDVIDNAKITFFHNFPPKYCTNFAARAFFEYYKVKSCKNQDKWSGNAYTWVSNANSAGWLTTNDQGGGQIGSIMVWEGATYGHVAIVTEILIGNGTISYTIAEMNSGSYTESKSERAAGITVNFGKVTWKQLKSGQLNRGLLTFIGFVLPSNIAAP